MFTSKNLTQSTRRGLSFLKGATFFFLGMSVIMFAAKAFEVMPSTTNLRQVIQKIILTDDGSVSGATGIVLDGEYQRVQSNRICSTNGTNCKLVSQLLTGVDLSGYLTGAALDNYLQGTGQDQRRCMYSGSKIECFQAEPSGGESIWMTGVGGVAYYNSGNVGIGTDNPQEKLEVNGNIQFYEGSDSDRYIKMGNADELSRVKDLYILGKNAFYSVMTTGNKGGNIYIKGGHGSFAGSQGGTGGDVNINGGTGGTPSPIMGNVILANEGGNVGIGTASPSAKLHVAGTGLFDGNVGIGTASPQYKLSLGGNNRIIGYYHNNFPLGEEFGTINLFSGRKMIFSLSDSGVGIDPLSFIFSGGNVGIGTSSPTAKLTVDGGIKAKTWTYDQCGGSDYPEGTMFYAPSHEYSYYCLSSGSGCQSVTLPSMYCICNASGVAIPINGTYKFPQTTTVQHAPTCFNSR